jgi:hypothetical protein
MTRIIVKVAGSSVTATATGKLTSGMVGIHVSIEYDSAWEGMIKTAVFKVGSFSRDRRNVGTETTVPWEVMRYSGKPLEVGVEGKDQYGNIVMPTVWSPISMVYAGANASIPAAPNPEKEEGGGGSVGADGTTFYPAVSAEGVISWTNDGGKENPDPVDLVAAVISALPVYNGEVEDA